MKRSLVFVLVVVFGALPVRAQKAKDAVMVDSDVHRVVLENDHVRVFEARASHGARSAMHSHPPMVFIGLETARVKFGLQDGTSTIFDIHPGQVLWLPDGMEHSWELIGGNVNVIAVEVKSAQKRDAAPVPVKRRADDAVAVDPDVHHVLFENEHVRVFDGRASKGRKSPMHSHPPSLLVTLGQGRGKLTMRDGTSVMHDYTPGAVTWAGDGMEHSWEMLSGDPRAIVVEVKSAHKAAPAKGQ